VGGAEAGMEGAGDGVVGPELGVGHAGGVEDDGTGVERGGAVGRGYTLAGFRLSRLCRRGAGLLGRWRQ
jgi:hypothetical protein